MVRFVLDPEGRVIPDVACRLPGRGVWLTAARPHLERALKKKLFSKGFKTQAKAPDDLPEMVEQLLTDRLISLIALARKAGAAVTGFEKTKAVLTSGRPCVLLQALDGAAEQRAKLARLSRGRPQIGVLTASELGLAFGRGFAIHAALDAGGLATRALTEAWRLSGFRSGPEVEAEVDPAAFGELKEQGPRGGLAQDIG